MSAVKINLAYLHPAQVVDWIRAFEYAANESDRSNVFRMYGQLNTEPKVVLDFYRYPIRPYDVQLGLTIYHNGERFEHKYSIHHDGLLKAVTELLREGKYDTFELKITDVELIQAGVTVVTTKST